MKIGMLWFDDDPKRPLEEKIERAALRYKEKYGVTPNLCYAHPRTLEEGQALPASGTYPRAVGESPDLAQGRDNQPTLMVKLHDGKSGKSAPQVTLKQARSILPNHFWLGVAES